MKEVIRSILSDPTNRYFFYISDVLAVVTIMSVVSLVLETVPSLAEYIWLFTAIEWLAVVLFSIEYLARLWVSNPTWRYLISFFGIVDLLAILPTFIGAGNLTFLKSARALRVVRLLRIVRIAKLSHLKNRTDESIGVVGLNAVIYCSLLILGLLLTGTLIYLFEADVQEFASIPAGMWWAMQVFAGGIPVEQPLTNLGGVVYVLARFFGFVLLGVLVGVIGNVFKVTLLK